jgi:L-fucose isomerase-like protein
MFARDLNSACACSASLGISSLGIPYMHAWGATREETTVPPDRLRRFAEELRVARVHDLDEC